MFLDPRFIEVVLIDQYVHKSLSQIQISHKLLIIVSNCNQSSLSVGFASVKGIGGVRVKKIMSSLSQRTLQGETDAFCRTKKFDSVKSSSILKFAILV